jgi:hypothetical protein
MPSVRCATSSPASARRSSRSARRRLGISGLDRPLTSWAIDRSRSRRSASYPAHHYDLALTLALRPASRTRSCTHEIERPEYRANPVNRCYYCKDELYTVLGGLARARGLSVIVDGNNADDRGDYRPGRQAAREAGVRSPLDEVGLDKASIRALAHRAGLPQWDEPASACLSSRVPYEQAVTPEKLRAIEQAETGAARSAAAAASAIDDVAHRRGRSRAPSSPGSRRPSRR